MDQRASPTNIIISFDETNRKNIINYFENSFDKNSFVKFMKYLVNSIPKDKFNSDKEGFNNILKLAEHICYPYKLENYKPCMDQCIFFTRYNVGKIYDENNLAPKYDLQFHEFINLGSSVRIKNLLEENEMLYAKIKLLEARNEK